MKTTNLSLQRLTNSVETDFQTFVPIGDGLEVCLTENVKNGDSWEICVKPFTTKEKVIFDIHGNRPFIVSPIEELSVIDHNTVWKCTESNSTNQARSQWLVNFNTRTDKMVTYFGHVFIAKDRGLYWSELDDPSLWSPMQTNESDFRVIEWEFLSITALIVVEDQLFIHTPAAMYQAVYTGKPNIINIRQRLRSAGAVKQSSIQVYGQIQFFLGTDNFYLWSPDHGLTPIGQEVWLDFCLHRGSLDSLWSYHDKRHNEICWVSGSTIWVFNYLERHWSKQSVDSIKAHCNVYWTSFKDACSDECMLETNKDYEIENIWISSEAVARELREDDECLDILPMKTPFLVTDDFNYGDLHFENRVDLIAFDAWYGQPWTGLKVSICNRDFISQGEVWHEVGIWRKHSDLRQIDFKTLHGKVWKYKFELVDDEFLTLDGSKMLNGHSVDNLNGAKLLDGCSDLNNYCLYRFDGSLKLSGFEYGYGKFRLAAWGERVDIEATNVGPDK